MKNGYEQFFKKARENSSESGGVSQKPSAKNSKPKFKLNSNGPAPKASARAGTPEQRLRQELAERVQRRGKASIQRKRQSFPVFPSICVILATACGIVGYSRPDLADRIFGKIEIGVFGNAQAAAADAKSDPKVSPEAKGAAGAKEAKAGEKTADGKSSAAEKSAESEAQAKAQPPADFRQWSDEEISFFSKLNDRKKQLDLREAELNKLEEELQKQKAELDQKIKQLDSMRADISKTLKSRVATDQEKVDKLVQFYSTMKPQQAAKVIESVNEDLAVEVLDKMKKKNAAEILNAMDSKKARRLSELLTGYERSTASVDESAQPADDGKKE